MSLTTLGVMGSRTIHAVFNIFAFGIHGTDRVMRVGIASVKLNHDTRVAILMQRLPSLVLSGAHFHTSRWFADAL